MVNKIPIIVLLFITAVDVAVAQDTIASQMELIFAVESLPSFGNDRKYSKLIDFVESNLTYEDTLSRTKTVYVCFAVDTLGFTRNHSVLRSDDSLLNEEALSVDKIRSSSHATWQTNPTQSVFGSCALFIGIRKRI